MDKPMVFFPNIKPERFQYAVIAARYNDQWVLVHHKDRDTYEIPGGHIEDGETPSKAAERELYEESGAIEYKLHEICCYGVRRGDTESFGMLYYANVAVFKDMPNFEIAERTFFDELPVNLTYPEIQPLLLEKIDYDAIDAHKSSANHKKELKRAGLCGCFYCLKIFDAREINTWIRDPGGTAICPYCGIDSVIGDTSGYPITEDFMARMKKFWF